MRTILFALATMAAGAAFNIGAAQARDYPFCLKNSAGPGDCKYDTYEQCLASASGIKGYCQPNYGPRSYGGVYEPSYGYGPGYGYGPAPRGGRNYGQGY